MNNNQQKLIELQKKIDALLLKQAEFSSEINVLQLELNQLQQPMHSDNLSPEPPKLEKTLSPLVDEWKIEDDLKVQPEQKASATYQAPDVPPSVPNRNLEKLFGQNIVSILGIAILALGAGVGVKYFIENDLISPAMRIAMGYFLGASLIALGFKLKPKYLHFSAVLLGGASAILYFVTFAGYTYYHLFDHKVAFAFMLLFTFFTIYVSWLYDKQIIAILGLVGAYAIPFLLSEGKGNANILFTYMSIINLGVLIVATKKYWMPLYYSAFGLTYIIFLGWFAMQGRQPENFGVSFGFLAVFFILFYATFLVHKLVKNIPFQLLDVLFLLINSFVFYLVGLKLLGALNLEDKYLAAFTLLNAFIHGAVSLLVYARLQDSKPKMEHPIIMLLAGTALVFLTISIPVQFSGNIISLFWVAEAFVLFAIARYKKISFYEFFAYVLFVIAALSLLNDWNKLYLNQSYAWSETEQLLPPFANIFFVINLCFAAFAGAAAWVHYKTIAQIQNNTIISHKMEIGGVLWSVAIVVLYFCFFFEIDNFWEQRYLDAKSLPLVQDDFSKRLFNSSLDRDMKYFKTIWLITYSFIFMGVFAMINRKRIKSDSFAIVNMIVLALFVLVFLTKGLYEISELRESYLEQNGAIKGVGYIWIRYVALVALAFALWNIRKYCMQDGFKVTLKTPLEIILAVVLLWISSSELLHWLDMFGNNAAYKLVLSIYWGLFCLLLISFGLWKKQKHLRITAMVVFGVTLLKLFAYDLTHLSTISKTIVLISLGVFLLVISFLYNKFIRLLDE